MSASRLPSQSAERPDVSVIVVNYNTAQLLGRMFAALEASRGTLRLQVIVVDNASRDNSIDMLRTQYPDVELIENQVNVGFARANNQALPYVRGRYILLLNTDAFVSPDTLEKTVGYMHAHPRCGVLGVKLVGADGELQPSCRYFPTPWNEFLQYSGLKRFFPNTRLVDDFAWDHASVRECDWVPGCYYLVRREVIDRVGLFDPRYFLYSEEVDHCWAVRQAGWSVVYYPYTSVVHIGGESAKSMGQIDTGRQVSALQIESKLLYVRKHFGLTGIFMELTFLLLANAMKACSALFVHWKISRASLVLSQSLAVFRALYATRLGTQASR